MVEVYIVAARRTPIGNLNGKLSQLPAHKLGSLVIRACLIDGNVGFDEVNEVIMGQVLTAGQGQNTARQAAIEAGLSIFVPAYVVNMLCGSGLKAICLAYQAISNKDASIIIAGGQESMSMAHHTAYMRNGVKFGDLHLKDSVLVDGLMDAFKHVHMGSTAEYLARSYKVSRELQDKFAALSQNKAECAMNAGYFNDEMLHVSHPDNPAKEVKVDEYIRHGTTFEKLAKLRPVFESDLSKNPSVTAGNSSGINDGAAAVLLVDGETLKAKNLEPIAKIVGFAQCGIEPMEMGLGPIDAVKKLVKKINWTLEDVDLFEFNEAFAVQSLLVIEKLGVDVEKVNINGGAIALGHPIGCSGARILVTLLHNLKRLDKSKGIAALCIGGGMGIAIAVERQVLI
ncbi:acetyl-CoA acetyltransferase, cytosolic [Agrilus planipennis]|uniref:Acetyl-CoA acetyltransferase, cytosolic n=1 Tax=Agrilus planipennis TaxID=224129 RepID=A0A1W4X9Q3_AGRPL|nr:acetyl-CoA acetyltransferase, cytosolic [Agrilus planipennis]